MNRAYFMILFLSIFISLQASAPQQDLFYSFLKPIKCTKSGLRCFFRHTFNNRMYAEEFMPLSLMHIVDLLEFGKNLEQPRSFVESIFSLFHERFQEARYANPYAVHELLLRLPELLSKNFVENHDIAKMQMQEHLTEMLKDHFDELKSDPKKFLFEVTDNLYTLAHQQEDLTILEAQMSVVRLIDQLYNKLIWDVREGIETWNIFKLLLEDIHELHMHNVIPQTKIVNQLMWAAIYRFGYFIQCAGSELPVEFYDQVKTELRTQIPTVLLMPEQEDLLTTKIDRLQLIITEGEVKARAKAQGIITDQLLY